MRAIWPGKKARRLRLNRRGLSFEMGVSCWSGMCRVCWSGCHLLWADGRSWTEEKPSSRNADPPDGWLPDGI